MALSTKTAEEIVELLVARGNRRDRAAQYADAFLEYREAAGNIAANGVICSHPRTGAPIENPYLPVRDRALQKLQRMGNVKGAEVLW